MRFLLTSAGIKNASIHNALVELLGKPIAECSALYIPTAAYAYPSGASMAYRLISGTAASPLCELGWKSLGVLELTALPSIKDEYWVAAVQETDALLVGGGDPRYLCSWMRQSGLADLLPSLRPETVYVGVSGGSWVMTPVVATYDDGEWPTGIHRALGLVDFTLYARLDHPAMPDASLANIERWAAAVPVPTYAIDDETAIRVTDGTVDWSAVPDSIRERIGFPPFPPEHLANSLAHLGIRLQCWSTDEDGGGAMRVVVSQFISLDGVAQAPGGPQEDTSGGFRHGGWSLPFFDPAVMGAVMGEVAERSGALLQGRRTYQVSATAWPERSGDPFSDWINGVQKYVVSDTLAEADLTWTPTTIIRGADLLMEVSELRQKPGGDVYVYGSLSLVRSLLGAELVDELILMIEPITLGGGKTLFPNDGTLRRFELTSAQTAATGVQVCRYRPTH